MNQLRASISSLALILILASHAFAQVEIQGWGELRGVRLDGELAPIRSTLVVVQPNGRPSAQTQHWRTTNSAYRRDGESIMVDGQAGPVAFRKTVTDTGPGAFSMKVDMRATTDVELQAVQLILRVPVSATSALPTTRPTEAMSVVKLDSGRRQVEFTFDTPQQITLTPERQGEQPMTAVSFAMATGKLTNGQSSSATFHVKVSGSPDTAPATITLDPSQRGSVFAGVGGNFCWQLGGPTPEFYLNNLRVAWARVNVPLNEWHPDEAMDPSTQDVEKMTGNLGDAFRISKEIHKRGIPMLAATWDAPPWAYRRAANAPPGGRAGGSIAADKLDAMIASMGKYFLKMKEIVGVEPVAFSFNESNLGINVRMTPDEHRDFIKKAGAHFESIGLKTKLLLGDANEPRAVGFVNAGLADPEALKYVFGVSYHSWNSGTPEQLALWREAGRKANVPVFIAEGGTDPDAHKYRPMMNEPWYGIEEAVMYLDCMALSQPISILHWQLTPDYGFVSGDSADNIRTSQRWFQFKQIDQLTPANSNYIDAKSDNKAITVCALAKEGEGVSVIHLANTGAAREVTLNGLPAKVTELHAFVTDKDRGIQALEKITVANGTAKVTVPAHAFLSLTTAK